MTVAGRTISRRIISVVLAALVGTALTIALGVGSLARAAEGPVDYVYIASGENFPDALVASTLAASRGVPLLLVQSDSIPQATLDALEALDPNRIVIVGGPAAVSDNVRDQLVAYASSGLVTRLSGSNRYATAAEVAADLPEVSPNKVYHINISSGASVRTSLTSEPLRDATVFRASGQPTGHYCVDIPDGLFDVFGTVGVIQSTSSSGTSGADVIRVTTTFSGPCQQAGAEIDVRTSNDSGSMANAYFTLLIPGA